MDTTNVGSDIYAITDEGRVVSVVLAALGMMMFPIFTVYITSVISNKRQGRENVLVHTDENMPQLSVSLPMSNKKDKNSDT